MTTWPTGLPKALLAGYNDSLPDNTIRSEMDVGAAKLRRRSTSAVANLSFTILLTGSQLDDLEEFYLATTRGGTLSFTMTHPRKGGTITARFKSPPQSSPLGNGRYNATVALEVLP